LVSGPNAGRQAVVWLDRPALGDLGLAELPALAPGDPTTLAQLESKIIADAQDVLRRRQHKLLGYSLPIPNLQSPIPTVQVFVEVQRRAPELIIVGAGHIAVPLAQMASLCDFAVTVLDDRVSFADSERFPTARRVIAAPLRETLRELPIDPDTFIVLVTRGHSHDVECLLEVLDKPAAYIGMIGSQRRVAAVFELLQTEMGIDPAKFDRVSAPIGIAIGAKTPAEIAVCILAEIINVLRGGPAVSISEHRRERARRNKVTG
jgi:xanthine dehydrogenase accessory factor